MTESRRALDLIEGEEYDFDLYDEAGPAGELKSSQPPLHDRFEASGFVIRIRCMHKIHGYLNGPGSTAACLVVMKITLGSKSDDRQRFYRKLCARFTFESDPPADPINDPYVLAFEPAGKGGIRVIDTLTKVAEGRNYEVAGGIRTDQVPISLDAKAARNRQEEFEQQSAYTVIADTDQTVGGGGGREGDNIVEWTCQADPRQTNGVGDFISFAILIHHSDETKPFKVHLDLEATVDWKYWIAKKLKSVLGEKKKRYLPLRIARYGASKTVPDGVDINRLEGDGNQLRKFGFVHVPEKLAPELMYQSTKISQT